MIKKIKKKIYTTFFKEFGTKNVVASNQSDFTKIENEIINKVLKFTLTESERLISLLRATQYIVKKNIKGSIVECGVWKGGSMMSVLYMLKELKATDRDVLLYDTFEGMTEPKDVDISIRGESANDLFNEKDRVWCFSSVKEVKTNINSVNYPSDKIKFIKGKVEDTINVNNVPEKIAILRLDTDWYESTKHELELLYPKLVKGGILIIDDYGHWQGCRKAVDEYFEKNNIDMFLSRVDYTCRIGVKK